MHQDIEKPHYSHDRKHPLLNKHGVVMYYGSLGDGDTFGEMTEQLDAPLDALEARRREIMIMMSAMAESPRAGDEAKLVLFEAELVMHDAMVALEREKNAHPTEAQAVELWLALQMDAYEAQGVPVDDTMALESEILAGFIYEAHPVSSEAEFVQIAILLHDEIEAQRAMRLAEAHVISDATDYHLAA